MHSRIILAAAAFAVVSSCSDSNSPTPLPSGSLSFDFTGTSSGRFSASGALTSTVTPPAVTVSWAAGQVDQGGIFVGGAQPQSGNTVDLFDLETTNTSAGTVAIDGGATSVLVLFGATDYTITAVARSCQLTSGTVVITSLTESRIVGTFSGAGECTAAGASTAFTIMGGTFDVPRLTTVP